MNHVLNGNVKPAADTQIQIALCALLDSTIDKNEMVMETIGMSLRKISNQHPNNVLKACCTFGKRKEPKPSTDHLSIVLSIMEVICKEHVVQIDGDTILLLIELCIELMIQNPSFEASIQMPASGVLVALGTKHCIQIVDGLMTKLSAGVLPHYIIPHTLGSLASANAFGVVPYLKNILGIMLPLFSGVKQDPMKQSFAYSIGRFCDAILEYSTNPEQAPDPTITAKHFQTEICMAYDIMFTVWLHARETKLIETVLYALAAMYNILSEEKVRQYTTKCVQVLLLHYRKHKEAHAITKCLGSVIVVASKTDGTLLEPQLGSILQTLSDFICISPDYAQPDLLRTHSEVLRCYECLCTHYVDNTLDHVFNLMKNNNDKERQKGLVIMTHLINSSDGVIKSRLKDVLNSIDTMLFETNVRIKRALMKAIVAVAYKGFLTSTDLPVEKYLQFIVKLCCKQPVFTPTEQNDISDLRQTADNTLYMLSTSVKDLDQILWNLLTKCLLSAEYSDASVISLRCLTHLALRKTSTESCIHVFARGLGLLALPLEKFRGTFTINFLKNIKLCDNEKYKTVWDTRLPYLLRYLEQNYDSLNFKDWEDLVLDFLSALLADLKDAQFEETLVNCIKEQLPLYPSRTSDFDPSSKNQEKSFLLKCLAIICCHLENKLLIQHILDIILQSVKLNDSSELLSCAEAIGICSRKNLTLVLDKLYSIRKDLTLKKTKFFNFGFMKDQKGDAEVEKVRYVIIASYAEICNEAPDDALLRIVQNEILDFVIQELTNCKEFIIRRICLKAVGSVADALHPDRNKLHIQLQDRDKVLKLVAEQLQLHSGPEYIELFPLIIPVITSLTKLPNILESNQRLHLLKLCFDSVFNASAIYCKLTNEGHGDVKLSPHVFASFSKVNLLVQELLMQSISPAILDEIFTLLEPWLGRKKLEQRLPSIEALRTALQTYLDNMKFAYEGPSTFGQTGIILARIVPRCTDPNKKIRKVAVECVCLMLCISGRYEGHMRDHDKILCNSVAHIQEQIDTEDSKLLFNLTNDLGTLISHNIPKHQMMHFVDVLIDGLLDVESSSSSGVAVVLNTIVKLKGGDMFHILKELLEKLLSALNEIKCARTRMLSFGIVLSFGQHHITNVVKVLLQQPLPYEQYICSCWTALVSDGTLIVEIFDHIKKILKTNVHYEEQKNAENLKIANLRTLQAICGLHELLKVKESHELCKQQFPELFTLLYISLASYINTQAPIYSATDKKGAVNRNAYKLVPFKVCLDTFKQFLQNAESKKAASNLLLCTETLPSFLAAVPNLSKSVCSEYPQALAFLVASLGPYVRSDLEFQRVAAVAMLTTLLKHKVNNQSVLAENILEMLLDIHNDQSCGVRKLCLKGIGYAAEYLNVELVQRHTSSILKALMQGLDYNSTSDSEVVLECMVSFSKLINVVENSQIEHYQVIASVRIKPLIQHESSPVREAAVLLFGDLAESIGTDDAFREQINGNLITILLHLCDEDIKVVKACKRTLKKIGVFLECPKVNTLIQDNLLDEANLQFRQFATDFIKAMNEDMQEYFPQFILTTLTFFKTPWATIRAHSALLTGLLYFQTSPEHRSQVSLDTLCYRLLQLLKDNEPEVRAHSSEAIANIFSI